MADALHPWVESFLSYISIEHGRSPRTVEAYRRDLEALGRHLDSTS
ncbi:MAG: site-specific integrase, partial [Actinomycetota bacterium]